MKSKPSGWWPFRMASVNAGDSRVRRQPEQSCSERQLYEVALDRLSREIAVVQHSTETEAIKEIESGLARNALTQQPVREIRATTDEELNAIIDQLLNLLADFKQATGISYTHVVPATHGISVRPLVRARGLGPVRYLINTKVQDLESRGGLPVRPIMEVPRAPAAPDVVARLSDMLWDFVNEKLAEGYPTGHLAQAYGALAMNLAERAGQGDDWLFRASLAETLRDMQSDEYPN